MAIRYYVCSDAASSFPFYVYFVYNFIIKIKYLSLKIFALTDLQ